MEKILERIKNLTQKQKIAIGVLTFIVIIIVFIVIFNFYGEGETETIGIEESNELYQSENNEGSEKTSKIGIVENKKTVIVHIVGEVNSPGVVTLNEGARIIDAINAAGGSTEEADLSKVNLAYIVEDGIQIYIPSIRDLTTVEKEKRTSYIREDAGDDIINNNSSNENAENQGGKVNINTANEEKLKSLPGIGESTAQKIIEYRNQNGKFKTEEDLKNVAGIGESKFNNLKDKITVK